MSNWNLGIIAFVYALSVTVLVIRPVYLYPVCVSFWWRYMFVYGINLFLFRFSDSMTVTTFTRCTGTKEAWRHCISTRASQQVRWVVERRDHSASGTSKPECVYTSCTVTLRLWRQWRPLARTSSAVAWTTGCASGCAREEPCCIGCNSEWASAAVWPCLTTISCCRLHRFVVFMFVKPWYSFKDILVHVCTCTFFPIAYCYDSKF